MSKTESRKPEETVSKFGETFDQVFEEELDCVRERWRTVYKGKTDRQTVEDTPTTENNLVGLAFSGGGIRSATINMGIAQALHRRGVFDHVDYMSTVSGGGYLGSSISTAMRRLGSDGQGEFPYAYQEPEAPAVEAVAGEPREVETKFLTWVRNNSNYLATGNFLDWPRIFGVLLRGILANFLVLLPILLLLAVGLVWYHGGDLAAWDVRDQQMVELRKEAAQLVEAASRAENRATGGDLETRAAADTARLEADAAAEQIRVRETQAPKLGSFFFWAISIAGAFVVLVLIFPVMIRVYKVYQEGEVQESSVASRGGVEKAFGILLLLILVAAAAEALPLLIRWFHHLEGGGLRGLYAGAGSGGALVVVTVGGRLLSKMGGLRQKITLLLVGLLGLVIPLVVALYVADSLVYFHPSAQTEAEVTQQFALDGKPQYCVTTLAPMGFLEAPDMRDLARLLPGVLLLILGGGACAALVGKLKKSKLRAILTGFGIAIGAFAGYCLLVVSSHLLDWLSRALGAPGLRPDMLVLAMAVVVFVFCWLAIDVNLTAILGMYRDRLAAAYLIGLWKKDAGGSFTREEEIFVEPDLNLEELSGGTSPIIKATKANKKTAAEKPRICCHDSKAPYHIVNTTLNLQGSKDPSLRDRSSDFFMFSKLYYGGHRTGYCETWRLEKVFPQMDLPTAMAISAAAASPNSGRATNKPLVALMTLLNVRLGYWVPHPGRLWDWLEAKKIAVPKLKHRWGWRIPPWALLREMASSVNEEDKWVNLSDGGHLENLAIYELLRRRCKYIICGDGEADATLTFKGLATLMRSARIDMGIEIEILLDDLHLDDSRKSRQHAALGRINYPPLTKGGKSEEGWLLYIKSSFTGNEDETMQEYRAKSPDFPHESTADQFFSEGQFEAYRALGFHMADEFFPPAKPGQSAKTCQSWSEFTGWFDELRINLAPRLSEKQVTLQKQLRRISKLLQRREFHGYFYELNPLLRKHDDRQAAPDKEAGMQQISYAVGQQIDLMESAFLSLNLDQPVNWNHPGNQGWRTLFENWADSRTFQLLYAHFSHLHSGRFQNFCRLNLGLKPGEESKRRSA